jgi:hypothetical protein
MGFMHTLFSTPPPYTSTPRLPLAIQSPTHPSCSESSYLSPVAASPCPGPTSTYSPTTPPCHPNLHSPRCLDHKGLSPPHQQAQSSGKLCRTPAGRILPWHAMQTPGGRGLAGGGSGLSECWKGEAGSRGGSPMYFPMFIVINP